MINLNAIGKKSRKIALQRSENGSRIDSDPLKACAGEVVEAAEARQKLTFVEELCTPRIPPRPNEKLRADFAEELADIVICAANEAARFGINLEAAVLEKVKKNEERALEVGDKL